MTVTQTIPSPVITLAAALAQGRQPAVQGLYFQIPLAFFYIPVNAWTPRQRKALKSVLECAAGDVTAQTVPSELCGRNEPPADVILKNNLPVFSSPFAGYTLSNDKRSQCLAKWFRG